MIAKNYYHALGISPRADAECVKKAFRRRAKETHPDTGAAGPFVEVSEAYEVLRDAGRRAEYDALFFQWLAENGLFACDTCGQANRVARIPMGKRPICASCKQPLQLDEKRRSDTLRERIKQRLGEAAGEVGLEAIHLAQDAALAGLRRLRRKFKNQ